MPLTVSTVMICLALATAANAQALLRPKRVSDTLAARILLLGEEVDLKRLRGGDKQPVFVRVYRVGEEGSCVDGTHWVCSFDYYAVVSEYGEGVEGSLFWLGRTGELREFVWLPRRGETAMLRTTALNYPEDVLRRQTNLRRSARQLILEIGADTIVVRVPGSRAR